MQRKGWYFIAYDIACPKRLRRVYKQLKREAMAVQYSLFFVKASEREIHRLLNRLSKHMRLTEDDIRAYPVGHPGNMWCSRNSPLPGYPVVEARGLRPLKPRKKRSFFQRVLSIFR